MSNTKLKISCESSGKKAIIRIDGYISEWSNHSAWFKTQVDSLVDNGIADAEIYINSGGGSCFEANEIVNELSRFTGLKTARLGALCASAATYIASKCDNVVGAMNVSYMIHKPSCYASGNSGELESTLKLLKNLENEYSLTYSKKTGLSVEKIESMWVEDYWMNIDEAIKLGFINDKEGEAELTPEDISVIKASGYKNIPQLTATAQTKQNNMKHLLIPVLALQAAATDSEIIASIEVLKAKASKADEFEKKFKDAETKFITDRAENDSQAAVDAKKILASQKDYYRKNLITDYEGTKAVLDAMPGIKALSSDIIKSQGNSVNHSGWTYADYQEKDAMALAELAEQDPDAFQRLAEAHYKQKF